ncbi:pseudaminic acid synthase [Glycocaulis abyssi]|uniref:Pseudaminic acid synthase n=1 Tax=Glycocaulis abyssi TaxID=1433403 RepID=A0ABV9NCL3_9PROT
MTDFVINGRHIGAGHPPYLIAELSGNHNGSLDRALAMIDAALAAGADAVKLQTYRADTITLDSDAPEFTIRDGLWAGRRLYDLYAEASTPWDWHEALFAHARKTGITIFSSPFDHTAVNLLESLGAPAYKIASFELVDTPLIRRVAQTGKPLIMSTGMADIDAITEAVATARAHGAQAITLLRCVSGYPAPAADYNLATMTDMAARFGTLAGLSDHTLEDTTAIAAVALGASVVEKHFTLARGDGGPDAAFSLEPEEFARLARSLKAAHSAIGSVNYVVKASEQGNVQFRRSLYFVRDLPAGAVVGPDDVRSVRPGHGLAPRHYDAIMGQKLAKAVRFAQPCSWDDFEG